MKKKALIYPFSNEFFPIMKAMLNSKYEYEIVSAVTPKAWFLAGAKDDVSKINGSSYLGIGISNNFVEEMKRCDTVIIAHCNNEKLMYKDIISKIRTSIEFNKNIICCFSLEDRDILEIGELSKKNNIIFKYLNEQDQNLKNIEIIEKQKQNNYIRIHKPDAAVIFVGKMLDELDSTSSMVSISENYKEEGYNVITISLNNNCKLLGYIPFPYDIFRLNNSIEEKVFLFNYFINQIEATYRPDLIVIQLPGGMMKYSDIITNGFGIYTYLISQALSSDYFILVTPFDQMKKEFYEKLSECFWHRFGFKINIVNMLNMKLDFAASVEKGRAVFNYLPMENLDKIICENFEESKIPVFNPLRDEGCEKMFRNSISTLTKYVNIV
ncbi:TIGR04066 family peptide maturation system protein [Clostridium felsineum]|uniref:Uncharacterized protein n=1 Tax=Clostridium felsineum TaxID=36839 RepID=A0A1S8L330_9CLOT|nr:TIGR04066 family peptide maturation system protein [Clostridium felsineum]URZ07466.1 hypothetical protein CLROS_028040 [Clostridium felsineum]URZ12497.1 hypothetical protein CROST_032190 [Clostridium felsineum]